MFRIPARDGVAVRAPARHQPAAGGAVRDRCQRQPAAGLWTNTGEIDSKRRTASSSRPIRCCASRARPSARTCRTTPRCTPARSQIDGCPDHLPVGQRPAAWSRFDVAAWADLWFYSNPIFIEVSGSTRGRRREVSLTDVAIRRRAERAAPFVSMPRRTMSARCDPHSRTPLARAPRGRSWLREPLLHFVVLGGRAVRRRPLSSSAAADDPRTIVVDAEVDAEALKIFKARTRPRAQCRRALCAAPGVARQRGALSRRPRAAGRQGRHGDPRARDLQGAERGRRQVKLPPLDDQRCASGSRAIASSTTSPRATTFRKPCSPATRSEAAVRAFVAALNAGAPGDAQGGAARVQGPAARQPRAELRARVRQGAGGFTARRVARAAQRDGLARDAARGDHAGQAGRLRARCAAWCCRTGPTPPRPSSARAAVRALAKKYTVKVEAAGLSRTECRSACCFARCCSPGWRCWRSARRASRRTR